MYAEQEQKVCKGCIKAKEKKEFSRISRGKQVTQPYCRACRKVKEFVRGLKRFYNMTPDQYDKLLESQHNSCACCGAHKDNFKRNLHVDHHHATGHVRALLCTRCNPLIGFAKEDIKRLEMAVEYLKKFLK